MGGLVLASRAGAFLMTTIVQIQSLRAAAAISVVLVHFNHVWLILNGMPNAPIPLYPLASGVDLFFVISGFIMVHSSENLFGKPGAWWTFLSRRLTRIIPLYWIATALMAVPTFRYEIDWSRLLWSLVFVPATDPNGTIAPLLGVGWTLNVEMLFYVLFALAVSLPRRFAVLTVCAAVASMAALGHVFQPTNDQLRFWYDPIILEFSFGAALAILYRRGIVLPTTARAILIVCGFAAVWLSAPSMIPSGYRFLLWGIPAASICAGAVLGPRNETLGSLTTAANILGDSSYAIYLIHPLATTAVVVTWGYFHLPIDIELPLVFVGTIVISIFAHYLIEKKATLAIRRRLENHGSEAVRPGSPVYMHKT